MSKKKRRRPARPAASSSVVRPPRRPRPDPDAGGRPPPVAATDPPPGVPEGVVGLVATGALDAQLTALQAAISRRWADLRREAANVAAARLRVGDRVQIVHGIRPQYLQGATGTVTGWSGRSAVVQLDVPVGRYGAGEVCCPPLGLALLVSGGR